MISRKYLQHGFGFLVLTVKTDEVDVWRQYCKETGREKDLIVVEPGGGQYFNFLEYESTVKSETSYAHNLLQLLKTVIEASEERSSGSSQDSFWENALELYILNIINLCLLAYDKVTVPLLYEIAQSAPKQRDQEQVTSGPQEQEEKKTETAYSRAMERSKRRLREMVTIWKSKQSPEFIASLTNEAYEALLADQMPEFRTLKMTHQFFSEGLYRISDKTRAIIDFCFASFLNRLLSDPIYTLFCSKPSTFTPESCLEGKIVVINLPVKIYDKVGQDAQTLVKYVFQRAWERRNLSDNERPLCLWSDEAHFFLTPFDTIFQTTARGSRIAVVYLSQNLPGFYANMGGDSRKSEYKVKNFMGTLTTKIFHANNCVDTNQWAAELIGSSYSEDVSRNVNMGNEFSVSKGTAYSLEQMVRPELFSRLKTGGPLNKNTVEAFIHCQGKTFRNGYNYKRIRFTQKNT